MKSAQLWSDHDAFSRENLRHEPDRKVERRIYSFYIWKPNEARSHQARPDALSQDRTSRKVRETQAWTDGGNFIGAILREWWQVTCRCGHEDTKHHHGHSCTAIVNEVKLKYCKCEEFLESKSEGENEMAKKAKVKSIRGEKLYEAYSSKIEASAIGKKVADKEHKGHTPLVARVLLSFDKPVTATQVITAAKNSGYKSDNVERCVRGDLAILVREGLAKATKIEAAAPKKARKPRAAKKSKANGAEKHDVSDKDIPQNEAGAAA
jgi:hypothetical protein